jgi:hypothetical protein
MKRSKLMLMVALCLVLVVTLLYLLPVKKWIGGVLRAPAEDVVRSADDAVVPQANGTFSISAGDSLEHMTIDGKARTYTAHVPEAVVASKNPFDVFMVRAVAGKVFAILALMRTPTSTVLLLCTLTHSSKTGSQSGIPRIDK